MVERYEYVLHTFNWVANQRQSYQLPKSNIIDRYEIRLDGALTIATQAGTAVHEDNPYSLIPRIELKANGHTFRHLTGAQNFYMDQFQYGTEPANTPTLATVATHTFDGITFVDMGLKEGDFEGFLPAHALQDLEIAVTWGTYTDLVTPDGSTVLSWGTTPTIEVVGIVYQSPPHPKTSRYAVENIEIKKTISASGDLTIDLPRRNELVAIYMFPINNSVRSNTIVTNLELVVNGTKRHKVTTWKKLQAQNKSQFHIETMPTGIGCLVVTPTIDARRANQLELIATCGSPTGTAELRIVPVYRIWKGA